ncbi:MULTISPECIES: TetR/AcrR family transcriptional regulator [Roseivirga]|jgi:AcrR family transcriptional regulator|uniref:TetR family transcriptional regulator n=1 Tax=Roseivirga thermotolerans TaxID=1758176 RepID=A0ABQ3I945_9BACT|nr:MULTISPECIES: TetR/AcrR family transcriptional regulator [Roseivirga]MEC7753678.1 TetR/AcrR family transcriptional regulator [Bacteroidota bacterium]GHE64776.1 TetR family transcriptional regulator [Roseivirga thermotolerans]|tara:strand:+ start:9291 stop:9872 length:582 start_codon:yes stop_codon:yes gene_type:complete
MEILVKKSRKQQIEEKATKLFREKGYAATSMRDLAQVLGIEAASLYSHIKSKEEILQKICFRMADQFFAAWKEVEKEQGSFSAKMEKAAIAHVKVITKDTDASAVFFHEWRHLSEPHLSEFLMMREDYEGRFKTIIRNGIENGEFEKVDEKFMMLTILSSLNWTYNWYKPTGSLRPEEIGKQLANLILNGLKK